MMDAWRPYLTLFWRYRYRLLGNALLATLALACALGLLALSGWFLTATALAGMTLATAQAFNFFTPGALVRFFAMGRTAGRYGERVFGHSITLTILAQLRGDFFKRLIPFAPGARTHQAELLQRMQQDIDALDHLYLRFFAPLLSALILLSILMIVGSQLAPELTLGVALVLLSGLLLLTIPYRKGQRLGAELAESEADFQVSLYEYLGQLAVIRSFSVAGFYQQRVERVQTHLCQLQRQLADQQAYNRAFSLQLPWLLLFTLFTVAPLMAETSFWQGPEFACVLFLFLAILELAAPLPDAFLFLGRSQTAVARLQQSCSGTLVEYPEQDVAMLDEGAPELLFDRVSFAYPACAPVLNRLSFELKKGSRTGLVGPSGIGKSTLIGLLARWFDPLQGDIQLSGQPIGRYSETQLRQQVAIFPQQVDLLSGSLAENLRLANPQASTETLLSILAAVELDYLATSADELERCVIGPGGRTLSGGERRRIGLARLLLTSAPFWVLDEPTEGLDLALERRMLVLLEEALEGRTLLLISHRPQTLALCQQVLHLGEQGVG